jgi:hypothetical protein
MTGADKQGGKRVMGVWIGRYDIRAKANSRDFLKLAEERER